MTRYWWIAVVALLLSACGAPGPESAARVEFEKWAKNNGVPYQNVQVRATQKDETFATVRVTAEFRDSPESSWVEQEAENGCRKVGQEWQCDRNFSFKPTARFFASATATAQAVIAQLRGLGRIVFVATSIGDSSICVISADGGNLRCLTEIGKGFYPTWFLDGRNIAYLSQRDGRLGVYSMDSEGKDSRLLANRQRIVKF